MVSVWIVARCQIDSMSAYLPGLNCRVLVRLGEPHQLCFLHQKYESENRF